MKTLDATETETLDEKIPALIEARSYNHTQWDSDYVGNKTMNLAEAREFLRQLRANDTRDDCDWSGWEFRVLVALDGDSYNVETAD